MPKLIMVRHGKSELNLQNRFAGWVDTPLAEPGVQDAREAGQLLVRNRLRPQHVFVSPLKRAQQTWAEMQRELGEAFVTVDWRLMERHYGALAGQSRDEIEQKMGKDVYMDVRRGYAASHPEYAGIRATALQYGVPEARIPLTESLQTLAEGRVKEVYEQKILPKLRRGEDVLVVAHGNTMRALTAIIRQVNPADIRKVEYKQGEPIVLEFAPDMTFQRERNLKE
jgi:2,3-bisphosphoglycerate-dependent phosphoglycerate mutase